MSTSSSNPSPRNPNGQFSHRGPVWLWSLFGVLVVALVGYSLYRWLGTARPAASDMVGAMQANSRGIGYMEKFEYEKALEAFEEVTRLAPDWLPGRINLGIALLNTQKLSEAIPLFEEILKEHPDDAHAHFCLGMIYQYQEAHEQAAPHFEAVTRIDPTDASAWYWLGTALPAEDPRQKDCYKRAVELDPYMTSAIYALAMDLRAKDLQKAKELLDRHERLKKDEWGHVKKIEYGLMGPYAEVIGLTPDPGASLPTGPLPLFSPDDKFQVTHAAGTRWATSADFAHDPAGRLRREIRNRFGGVLVVLDYNRDGRPDLLLLAAVVQGGAVRDLLLRNDGDGRFTDVTTEAGLAENGPGIGCCVGDFDNDGLPDLFITGVNRQRLLRNTGQGRFEDVTAKAGLDKLTAVCLTAAFLDLDQDGDLDLVVARYADTPDAALHALASEKPAPGAGLGIYLNVGDSPAATLTEDPPPLLPRFRPFLEEKGLPLVGVATTDLDADNDLDLLLLYDQRPPAFMLNDRLLQFHRAELPATLAPAAKWNGALALDINRDGRSDLFLLPTGQKPIVLLNQAQPGEKDIAKWYTPGATDSPPLLQAQAIDLDLDGLTDIVGLSAARKPVLLHNDGHRLVHALESLGSDRDWPSDLVAVAATDLNGDGHPDLITWSESKGLQLRTGGDNGNHGLFLELSGHRHVDKGGLMVRANADGIGTVVRAETGDSWSTLENGTLSAGLGQSRQPLVLGLGKHPQPEVVRLRWPDNVIQAEFTATASKPVRIDETNRRITSCPVLFAWDGKRYGFLTDFLGAGTMGERQAEGGCRPPRPEESVKIEPGQLAPRNGFYEIKVAEPMDEVVYLDRLRLIAIDHPADVAVYPDERFVSSGPPVTQDLLVFRDKIWPVAARDHRGRDVTATLQAWDRRTVDGFQRRGWLGYAEEHWVELDFADRLARFGPQDRLVLCLAGWTDYPFPESIWAATQAGVPLVSPVLERQGDHGIWFPILADAGFPAGLPRMMTVEVTGKLTGPGCRLRLRSNMHVFWDEIFIAPLLERIPADAVGKEAGRVVRVVPLDVSEATLQSSGCAKEYSPDGRPPTLYDHDRLDAVPVSFLSGHLTRTGPVTELLRELDDRFVIFGPGDEVTVRFDARRLPPLPAGWQRSFVLRSWGYCKDTGPFTATGDTIEPLPFHAMKTYPYGPDQHYPDDAAHQEYLRRYNTRPVGDRPRTVRTGR
jgi:cytochrome c-type biogenesis protein CcmH/NrfG